MAQGGKTLVFVHKTSLIKCLIKGHNAQRAIVVFPIRIFKTNFTIQKNRIDRKNIHEILMLVEIAIKI